MYEAAFKNIDDTLRKDAGCSSELDYIEQTSWILFLKYLDDYETEKQTDALLKGSRYRRIIDGKFRWSVWAAPKRDDGKLDIMLRAKYGSVYQAQKILGAPEDIRQTFIDFQRELYA